MSSNMWDQDAMLSADEKYRAEKAETPGLDREAVARIATFVHGAMLSEMAIQALPFLEQEEPRAKAVEIYTNCITETIADAILAATAVSQPSTCRQGTGEVEALRALSEKADETRRLATEASRDQSDWPLLQINMRCAEREFKDAAADYARTHVLTAQPGPAPVVEPDA